MSKVLSIQAALPALFRAVSFLVLIVIHVALALTTGLPHHPNHIYAGEATSSWLGFWMFVAAMVVVVAGWVAAAPLTLHHPRVMSGPTSTQKRFLVTAGLGLSSTTTTWHPAGIRDLRSTVVTRLWGAPQLDGTGRTPPSGTRSGPRRLQTAQRQTQPRVNALVKVAAQYRRATESC